MNFREAEDHLLGLELFGMRFGLERMHQLMSALGMPQRRFASIHVVGSNGKSSTVRFIAAILQRQGLRTGSYTSPHLASFRERIEVGEEPVSEERFAAAVEHTVDVVEEITQFEAMTAAAYHELAAREVEVAVIEAGLGGRLDATNVIPSKLTVLTSIGLDHTEWLGETLEEIAAEKLAVLRDHTTLVTGEVPPEVEPVIERAVERRHAKRVGIATAQVVDRGPNDEHPAGEAETYNYQDGNFALAWAAVQTMLGPFGPRRLELREALSIPGRAQLVEGDPDVIYDAAHNPDGARALARTLPDLAGEREVVCCLAVLEGKDGAGIVEALAPACSHFVCTEVPPERIEGSGRPGGRSHAAAELAVLCEKAGVEAEPVPDPIDAWRTAREIARERGAVALAAGSHYLLSCIWTERPVPSY